MMSVNYHLVRLANIMMVTDASIVLWDRQPPMGPPRPQRIALRHLYLLHTNLLSSVRIPVKYHSISLNLMGMSLLQERLLVVNNR